MKPGVVTRLSFVVVLMMAPMASFAVTNTPAKLTVEDLADAAGLTSVALSPDGRQIAVVRNEQIELVSSDGGWPQVLTTTEGGKQGIQWSPDGHSIAFVSQGSIWTVPCAGGQPVRLTEGHRGSGYPRTAADRDPQWSPDNKWILFVTGRRGNADLAIVSADGLTTTLLTGSPGDRRSILVTDGTRIAYVERSTDSFSGRVLVADFDKAAARLQSEPRMLYTSPEDGRGLVHSPPRLVAGWQVSGSGAPEHRLGQDLSGAGDGRRTARHHNRRRRGRRPVFSPSGDLLAFVSNRDKPEERHVWVVSPDGKPARLVADVSAGVDSDPIWSPDGHHLYYLHSSSFEPAGLAVAPLREGTLVNDPHTARQFCGYGSRTA